MKLKHFIEQLTILSNQGHGDKEVFYRQGSSGACGPLSSASITSDVDECGPFDVEEGEEYVSIYAGH